MTTHTQLTLAEELVLIALDDETGSLISLPQFSLEFALAAALVMELTLVSRIAVDAALGTLDASLSQAAQ